MSHDNGSGNTTRLAETRAKGADTHDTPSPKRVVYLWGAGATQAEIVYRGARTVNALMQDNDFGPGIASRILQQLPEKPKSLFMTDTGTDIEKLISLLVASGVSDFLALAEEMRKLYFETICRSLVDANVLEEPRLAIGLLTIHKNETFSRIENLCGIITTNHDGLLQLAAHRVHSRVDIGIPFESADFKSGAGVAVPIVQLHGSFTWTFGVPLNVTSLTDTSRHAPNAVWIPPAILKESKDYPFNKLAGLAYELLSSQCDVLRVVGASLRQNDWNVLSMIFNAQRHRELTQGAPFVVELILPHLLGEEIRTECSYLRNVLPIGHLTDGDFSGYKEAATTTSEMKNPLAYWMKEKIQFHKNRGDFGEPPLEPALAQIAGEIA